MKYAFLAVLLLSIASFSGPVGAYLLDGEPSPQIIHPVIETSSDVGSVQFIFDREGMPALHAFTLPLEDVRELEGFALAVDFQFRKGRQMATVFLPVPYDEGQRVQMWIIDAATENRKPILQFTVKSGVAKQGCVKGLRDSRVLRCTVDSRSGFVPLALQAIAKVSENPKATTRKLFGAGYYGPLPTAKK